MIIPQMFAQILWAIDYVLDNRPLVCLHQHYTFQLSSFSEIQRKILSFYDIFMSLK